MISRTLNLRLIIQVRLSISTEFSSPLRIKRRRSNSGLTTLSTRRTFLKVADISCIFRSQKSSLSSMVTRKLKSTMKNKSVDKKSTRSINSNKECQNSSASTTTEDTMTVADRNRATSIMGLAKNAKGATEETVTEIERGPSRRMAIKT